MAIQQIIQTFSSDIDRGEFNIAAIAGGDDACDWSYSVGLNRCFGHPELVIVGLDATFTGMVLEHLGVKIAQGFQITAGEEIEVVDGLTLRSIAVDEDWLTMGEWFALGQAVMNTWGERWPETIQLMWPDQSGIYPDTVDDNSWMMRQPVLSAQRCVA